MNLKNIKDPFEKTRIQLNLHFKDIETFLEQRDTLLSSQKPSDIYERKKLENKITDLLSNLVHLLSTMETELKAQKRKHKRNNNNNVLTNNEQLLQLMQQRYQLLKTRFDGTEVNEQDVVDNRTHIEQLDDIIKQQTESEAFQREIYEEEQNAIDEWEQRKQKQNEELNDLGDLVRELKLEAKIAEEGVSNISKEVIKVSEHADKTSRSVVTQNKQLKELVNKIRGGNKLCVDFVLVVVLLGLIAVLYSLIKK